MINIEKQLIPTVPNKEGLISEEKNHGQILDVIFDKLSRELDINGNTKKFKEMRINFADELFNYWTQKKEKYSVAERDNKLISGWLIADDERLIITDSDVYNNDNEKILQIKRETLIEKDEVAIVTDSSKNIKQFPYPPTIKSERKSNPNNDFSDLYYDVVFGRNGISKIKKTIIRTNVEDNYSYIKDIKEIDCSTFGI